ncbi:haloacid dehalogenase domain-containing protein hydrolase [Streptomyces malaysiensis]|uniref:Haloacid dehalogenase domain-containing protein hydrolase n=1 Tax=Streptomyces malaysiensis TaxID=92644 RepID=A0A7X6AXA7_STRMQ|nr:haloacid dehalogenase domain-containing protein hydrolase [Streptomyces malaysiensis]
MLWDFAHTLMAPEAPEQWLSAALDSAQVTAPDAEVLAWAERAAAAGFPCPVTPTDLTLRERTAWRHRAIDPDLHRAVYQRLLETAGLPWPSAASALYHRHMTAAGWDPYPDALPVLDALRAAGVRCAVVSNIGWDIRGPLGNAGILDRMDAVVCSYEVGIRKPDRRIYAIACDRLQVDPVTSSVIMVGDSRRSDTGGEILGIRTLLVDKAPPALRPRGLMSALATAGIA